MKKIENLWVDENYNRWNANVWTEEEALDFSYSLINCKHCLNCKNCSNCQDCKDCRCCRGCTNCINCQRCNGLNGKSNKISVSF